MGKINYRPISLEKLKLNLKFINFYWHICIDNIAFGRISILKIKTYFFKYFSFIYFFRSPHVTVVCWSMYKLKHGQNLDFVIAIETFISNDIHCIWAFIPWMWYRFGTMYVRIFWREKNHTKQKKSKSFENIKILLKEFILRCFSVTAKIKSIAY